MNEIKIRAFNEYGEWKEQVYRISCKTNLPTIMMNETVVENGVATISGLTDKDAEIYTNGFLVKEMEEGEGSFSYNLSLGDKMVADVEVLARDVFGNENVYYEQVMNNVTGGISRIAIEIQETMYEGTQQKLKLYTYDENDNRFEVPNDYVNWYLPSNGEDISEWTALIEDNLLKALKQGQCTVAAEFKVNEDFTFKEMLVVDINYAPIEASAVQSAYISSIEIVPECSVENCELTPSFNRYTGEYTLIIPDGTEAIILTPQTDLIDAVIDVTLNDVSIEGGPSYNIVLPEESEGEGEGEEEENIIINLNVTALQKLPNSYRLNVQRGEIANKVVYDGNGNTGGKVPVDQNTYKIGESATIMGNANGLTRTGYKFVRWNTASDGNGAIYEEGDTIAVIEENLVENNLMLYAMWEAIPEGSCVVALTYPENGTVTGDGIYQEGETVTLGAAPDEGYNFDGWYDEDDNKISTLPNYSFTLTGNITLIPKFVSMRAGSLQVQTLAGGEVKMNDDLDPLTPDHSSNYTAGSSIRLKASPVEGNSFAYWVDKDTNCIISTEDTYACVMGAGINVSAVFFRNKSETNNMWTVVFRDKSGKILKSGNVINGNAATPPPEPSLPGYNFSHWDKNFDAVAAHMIIEAVYTRKEDTYSVTIENGTISAGINAGKNSAEYKFDIPVTVTADTLEGKKFSHWEMKYDMDGNEVIQKVSTKETFPFYVPMKNITLTAVHVDENTDIAKVPLVSLSSIIMSDNNDIVYTVYRSVPAEYTLIESGLVLLKAGSFDGELTLDTPVAIHGKVKNDSTDQFYMRKSDIETGDTWYVRGYLIYKDANGNVITIYSDDTVTTTID